MTSVVILVVEDSDSKIERIKSFLSQSPVGESLQIDIAKDCNSARTFLRARSYDLLLLDVALPLFPDDQPQARAGLDLLRELHLSEDYLKPRYILGMTAHEDQFEELQTAFESRLWRLVRSSPSQDKWLNQVVDFVAHIFAADQGASKLVHGVDFAILCALYEPEVLAVLQRSWKWGEVESLDELTLFRRAEFEIQGRKCTVGLFWSARAGLVSAALLASKVVNGMRPRVMALCGICAGVKGQCELGDLVFASEAWTWETGKIVSSPSAGAVQPDPHFLPASAKILGTLQPLRYDEGWLSGIKKGWNGSEATKPLRFHSAPMACGSAVVADQGTVDKVLAISRKTIAIDMESYAVYAAAMAFGQPSPEVFCVKGVCDFANKRKDDSYQRYASYVSAAAVAQIFEAIAADNQFMNRRGSH